MVRAVAPLWLARPSRFAALDRGAAQVVAIVACLLLLACVAVSLAPVAPVDASAGASTEAIVEQVRHGAPYYDAAIVEIRHAGGPLGTAAAVPLPALATVQAWLPALARAILLYALILGVAAAWYARLRDAVTRLRPRLLVIALALAGVAPLAPADLVARHEVWAGLLVALSLGVRRPGRATASVALGLSAMLIDEAAWIYAGVMLVAAAIGGRRGEASGWAFALAIAVAGFALHVRAVSAATGIDVPWWPDAGVALGGVALLVHALVDATALSVMPEGVGAGLLALAIFGWAALREPLGLRVVVLVGCYGAALALLAVGDGSRWALPIAPVVPIGLVFAPDGIRDLYRAIRDRRRITVTRQLRGVR